MDKIRSLEQVKRKENHLRIDLRVYVTIFWKKFKKVN